MPDLKTELWAAASEAFPDGEVTIKVLGSGHSKLASRKLPAQYLVRVSDLTAPTFEMKHVTVKEDGKDVLRLERVDLKASYAVAAMFPQDGQVSAIPAFIEGLKSDAVRISDSFPK